MIVQAEHLTTADFDYDLPEDRIAQVPASERDRSRLLVLHRSGGELQHRVFAEIGDFLAPGDLLVLNDTRVFPCRMAGRKRGGGRAEIFLLQEEGTNCWRALMKGGVPVGRTVSLAPGVEAEVIADIGDGVKRLRFRGVPDIRALLAEIGETPLPPYIRRPQLPADRERYQTVYAQREGAVAAPTAGLHFTRQLLDQLRNRGVETAVVTLHVGPGTFQPVRTGLISDHRMHPELYEVSGESAGRINRARARGDRVIAVGTTSVRALETAADDSGEVRPGKGSTSLFIVPGYRFRTVDGMITNFHLPRSTLLMLVGAFAGRARVLDAYRTAVAQGYRFYSYGDAMLIA